VNMMWIFAIFLYEHNANASNRLGGACSINQLMTLGGGQKPSAFFGSVNRKSIRNDTARGVPRWMSSRSAARIALLDARGH
jgi:hypothetical protein